MNYETDPLNDLPRELYQTDTGVTVAVHNNIPTDELPQLWDMVHEGFADLNQHAYEQQDMTFEEFLADAESTDVLKYIARSPEGKPIGYLTVHVGLANVGWADTERLQGIQTEVDPIATPYYINTFVVPTDLRGTETARAILHGCMLHFQDVNQATGQNSLCMFDCCNSNYPWLGEFIQKTAAAEGNFPGVAAQVNELYQEYTVKAGPEGTEVAKLQELPKGLPADSILETQHFYALQLQASKA
jgi:hypothetical protein